MIPATREGERHEKQRNKIKAFITTKPYCLSLKTMKYSE